MKFTATEVQDCLREGEILQQIFDTCDEHDIDYYEGFIAAVGLDSDDERLKPMEFLYNVLTTDGEMNEREAISLLDNAVRGMYECIAERTE